MNPTLAKASSISFFLLGLSLLTSMAGLEFSAVLIIIVALTLFLKKPTELPFLKPFLVAFLPLCFLSLLSLALGQHWNAFFKILGWFRWSIFFLCLSYLLYTQESSRKYLFRGISVGAIAAFINSIVQYITGYDFVRGKVIVYFADFAEETTRVTGFFNLPTTLGYILAILSFIPLGLLITKWGRKGNWFHGLVFLLIFAMLVLTHTRGAWLSFLGGLFVFIFFTYRRLILPISLSIATLATILFFTHSGFQERISSLTNMNYYSNLQRIELWRANLAIFMDNPIMGVGLHQNDTLVTEYHVLLKHTEAYTSHAHNSYLQFLSGTGVLGFLSFLLFLSLFPYFVFRNWSQIKEENKTLVIGLLAAYCAFLVSCLFDCNFRDAEVRYSFLTSMALLISMASTLPKGLHKR